MGGENITTDNSSEFCAHENITKVIREATIYFSYSSWHKGGIENANKLIKQYVPKGTDFKNVNNGFLKNVQVTINAKPR